MSVHSARERFHSLLARAHAPIIPTSLGGGYLGGRVPIVHSQVRPSPMEELPREGVGTVASGIRETLSKNLP